MNSTGPVKQETSIEPLLRNNPLYKIRVYNFITIP